MADMDQAERRRELLRQSKRMLSSAENVPAVHPRYGSLYNELYGEKQEQPKSSLYIRSAIAMICFVCYIWMAREDVTVANVNSTKIVNQIEQQMDMETVKEVWRNL